MMKDFEKLSSFTFKAAPAAKSTLVDKEEEVKGVKTQKSGVRRVVQLDPVDAVKPTTAKEEKKHKEIEAKAR